MNRGKQPEAYYPRQALICIEVKIVGKFSSVSRPGAAG